MILDPHDKIFGAIAVKKGYVTEDQIAEALEIQRKEAMEKINHRFLGIILYDMGLMDQSQVLDVLDL